MSNYPDPDRYPVGSPERVAEQQRKNELYSRAVLKVQVNAADDPLMQALHDPENQPSQWGTVPVAMAEASRRERIATAAMTGFIARTEDDEFDWTIPGRAIAMADRMIAELDRKGEEG